MEYADSYTLTCQYTTFSLEVTPLIPMVPLVQSLITCEQFLNSTSGKNHFHEMNGDVGMAG